MPLVRINLSKIYTAEQRQAISDAIYTAMIETANVPKHDKFQIFTRHEDGELVYPKEGYLGIDYTPNIVFVQVFWLFGPHDRNQESLLSCDCGRSACQSWRTEGRRMDQHHRHSS